MSLIIKEPLVSRGQALSPWTGFYFLQSILINHALGYEFSVLYAVVLTAFMWVMWRHAPRTQKVLIGIFSLVAASYYPFGQAYGAPNFNTLLALHSTNMEESTEILKIFPWYHYAIGLLIFALGVVSFRRKAEPKPAWTKWDTLAALFCVGCYFVGPVQNYFRGYDVHLRDTGIPVLRFVRDVVVNNQGVIDEQASMAQLANMKDSWNVTAVKTRYHTYVVVIGESVRRDAVGAFGGHWNNSPFASQANGTFFMDYISASGSTQKSLGLTLNRVVNGKPEYQNNFVTLANRAGFQTWWFSNQGQIGEYDTAIASIAKRADEVQFLKKGDFEADKNTRDEDLLKMTSQVLSTHRTQPQLIVLHLMGSHPSTCERSGDKYNEFVQSKETSCYLYSITATDELLGKLYSQLNSSGESFSITYFSDHGLTFRERGKEVQYLAHDDKFQQNFQVPFMVISSDDKTHRVINARRSANDFLSFFSQWTGISAKEIKNSYPFMSEKKAGPVYVTNFKLQKIDYSQLATDIFEPRNR
ncbi:sulfatase-like hydrolase/transferase [Yokenella regensburgei]|uniref:phosphoethanolamine transferase n=1 Tax=Yokenella regensburgei TaxID=158877 RepID=UPI003F174AF4